MAHFQWQSGATKQHWQPGMPAPPPPPPMDPKLRETLITIKSINDRLMMLYESSEIRSYLDKLTVLAALRMWNGKELDDSVKIDPQDIQNCAGVKILYPYIKELEALCITIELPFCCAIDAIEQQLWRLTDECLITRFGEKFCRVNHVLHGRTITKSEKEEMRVSMTTRIPSFIMGGGHRDNEATKAPSTTETSAAAPPTYIHCALDYQSSRS